MRQPRKGKPAAVRWLWTNRLAWSTVAIVQGEKGSGKSTWLRAIAADVTGGPRLPGEKGKPRVAGTVLWFAGEEDLATRVEPGFVAAGGKLTHLRVADDKGDESDTLQLPNDCDRLAALIRSEQAVLVVIDPIFGFLDGTADIEGGSVPARRFMRSIRKVAADTGALILLSRNLTKDTSRGALASGRGSGELANAARSVLHTHTLPQTPDVYGLAVASANDGAKVPTLTYTLVGKQGQGVIHPIGTIGLTADELASGDDGDVDRGQLETAKALIRTALPAGELPASVFKALAERSMISLRTLQLAAKRLGVTHRSEGRRENTVGYGMAPKGGYQ